MAIPNFMDASSIDKNLEIDISELIDDNNVPAEIEDDTLTQEQTQLFSKATKSISIGLDPEKRFRFSIMLRNYRIKKKQIMTVYYLLEK